MTTNAPDRSIVLAVDLDGTLCRTDTLHEGLLALAAKAPLKLLALPSWLAKGRADLKARIADHCIIEPADLPLNDAVIERIRAARDAGQKTVLISAADHRQVTALAAQTGLFDEAYGSAEGQNLKGETKAHFLTTQYGEKGFDYAGDSRADLPVWAAARQAITVGARQALRKAAEAANPNTDHIAPPQNKVRAMYRAMRPHQWSKNILLFLPMLTAHDFSSLFQVILGFVAFCMMASTVYVVNDLLDLSADRAHPRKCKRPFAAGDLSAATGAAMAAGLMLGAIVFGLMTGNLAFLGVLLLYFIATFVYSLWLKRKLIVDVLMLAGLYTVRIIAGGAAASVVLSPWMLGFSMFLFLALAAIKRQTELTDQIAMQRSSSGRAYEVDDLPVLRGIALSAAHTATLVLALYVSSENVQSLYTRPEFLWLIIPMLLHWLLRMIMKAHRGLMTDDPIIFAATDRVSLINIAACVLVVLAAA